MTDFWRHPVAPRLKAELSGYSVRSANTVRVRAAQIAGARAPATAMASPARASRASSGVWYTWSTDAGSLVCAALPMTGSTYRCRVTPAGMAISPAARPTAATVLAALNNYIFGFAHRETARDQLSKRAGLTEQQWQQRLRRYAADTRPRDPELARDIETRMHLTSNDSFEFGLDCLLNGIAMRFAPTAPSSSRQPD